MKSHTAFLLSVLVAVCAAQTLPEEKVYANFKLNALVYNYSTGVLVNYNNETIYEMVSSDFNEIVAYVNLIQPGFG